MSCMADRCWAQEASMRRNLRRRLFTASRHCPKPMYCGKPYCSGSTLGTTTFAPTLPQPALHKQLVTGGKRSQRSVLPSLQHDGRDMASDKAVRQLGSSRVCRVIRSRTKGRGIGGCWRNRAASQPAYEGSFCCLQVLLLLFRSCLLYSGEARLSECIEALY